MALSNWDTLAVDERGQSTNGVFEAPNGVSVEIYKNWLYLRDPKAWDENSHYIKPTIARIQEGDFDYNGVNIRAIRGPQNGVYVVVTYERYKEKSEDHIKLAMIGIGCYGYDDNGDWIGVTAECKKFLLDWINKSEEEFFDLGDEQSPHKYTSYEFEEWIRQIKLDGALRFNQGDAYFAKALDFEIPATPPEESATPILQQAFDASEKKP